MTDGDCRHLLLTEDEADFALAGVRTARGIWLDSYQRATTQGMDRADYYLDHVMECDRIIAKVEAQAENNDGEHG